MIDRPWSLAFDAVYDDHEPVFDGVFHHHYMSELRHVRVAVKSGSREVLVFHAVRPAPPSLDEAENYFFTYRSMVDPEPDGNPHDIDMNPFQQLIADAELGRKVREAGLELK